MSGRPDFDAYYERDYLSSEEMFNLLGEGEHVLVIAGFAMRDSFDANEVDDKTGRKGVTLPKPVVFFDGMPKGKPVFMNVSSHDALTRRFGQGYSANEYVIGQLVTVNLYRKKGRDGEMRCYEILPAPHPDQRKPIGDEVARRWIEKGGDDRRFREWLRPRVPKLWNLLQECSCVAEFPVGAMRQMKLFLDETAKSRPAAAGSPAGPSGGGTVAGSGGTSAAQQQRLDRSTSQVEPERVPPQEPKYHEINEDDIPF